jgi:hypothetical protein
MLSRRTIVFLACLFAIGLLSALFQLLGLTDGQKRGKIPHEGLLKQEKAAVYGEEIPYEKLLKPEKVVVCITEDMNGLQYVHAESFIRVWVFSDDNENGVNDQEKIYCLRVGEDRENKEALIEAAKNLQAVVGEKTSSWLVIPKPPTDVHIAAPKMVNGEIHLGEYSMHIVEIEYWRIPKEQ